MIHARCSASSPRRWRGDVRRGRNRSLSCRVDNLRHNGEVARAFVGFASALDQELGAWIDSNVLFPNSLVDRITPSVTAKDAARLNAASGLADQIPLVAEDFSQWVIEDRFADAPGTAGGGRSVQ